MLTPGVDHDPVEALDVPGSKTLSVPLVMTMSIPVTGSATSELLFGPTFIRFEPGPPEWVRAVKDPSLFIFWKLSPLPKMTQRHRCEYSANAGCPSPTN